MKKFLFLLLAIFISCNANAQYVNGSHFRPFTFAEMAAPLIMLHQFENKCLDALGALAERTEQIEQFINKAKYPATW